MKNAWLAPTLALIGLIVASMGIFKAILERQKANLELDKARA